MKRYQAVTNIELRLYRVIIEKMKKNMNILEKETKTMKYVMQTPKLRNELKEADLKGLDF